MPRTRVKFCGFTQPDDVAIACELGVDAIGLNFVGGPRQISPERAAVLVQMLSPLVLPVALLGEGYLIYSPQDFANRGWRHSTISTFQLYDAAPNLAAFDVHLDDFEWWWVAHVAGRQSFAELGPRHDDFDDFSPSALLLDTARAGKLGGTGEVFRWSWIAEARAAGELDGLPPIILAGGLTPENVGEAIQIVRPYAVDVSSGVEVVGKPGVKDRIKMRDFLQAVRAADGA